MPKIKKTPEKINKRKLSPAERSKIAKDRWAKIKAAKTTSQLIVEQEAALQEAEPQVEATPAPPLDPPTVPQPSDVPPVEPELVVPVQHVVTPNPYPATYNTSEMKYPPVAQLAPVAPKKSKRYTGPKEFSVALKAAENRLAKAIVERAQAAGQLAALQAEIPSLMGIIQALKGTPSPINYNGTTAPSFDLTGYSPMNPMPPMPPAPMNLEAIMQAAQVPMPAFKSQGGAVQFGPDVVGNLEGPDDDADPDRFISGPHAGKEWI